MPIINLENVWKVYGMVRALRGVSLEVNKGELLIIMGPSGSGKSTLLHIIGLLDIPTKGKVIFNGKEAPRDGDKRAELRSKFLGFVFQDFALIPYLTAFENIVLPAIFSGERKEEKVYEISKKLGIEKRLNHFPSQLSGGEKQRVAIARALINDPKVILADEPTGNLDSKTGERIMKILRKLADEGRAVVVVTHNPEHEKFADKVLHLRDGKIVGVKSNE